jgi:predicted RNase H-like nuclease (RuvC/YqgF family)
MAKITSDSLKKKISKAQKQIEKLKDQLVDDSQTLFTASCREIFEKNPDFNSFSWTQYTPYWNDGDSCEFSANTDYLYIDDEEKESSFYNAELDFKELKQKEKTIKNLLAEIDKLKKQGKEDDWEIKHKQSRIEELNKLNLEKTEKRFNLLKDIDDLLKNIDQDTLEKMFGDHVKVLVTKDGIDVEQYEHD